MGSRKLFYTSFINFLCTWRVNSRFDLSLCQNFALRSFVINQINNTIHLLFNHLLLGGNVIFSYLIDAKFKIMKRVDTVNGRYTCANPY